MSRLKDTYNNEIVDALMKKFGSIEAVRSADIEELSQTETMNLGAARKVYDFFHPADGETGGQEAQIKGEQNGRDI